MPKAQSPWRSPWVLTFLMMGAIIIAANVYLIMIAGKNAPSLVADNYYERGQDYEQNMLKKRARDPGWTMQLEPPKKLTLGEAATYMFTLQGKDGAIVNPDSVTIHAYRPSDADADFSVPMKQLDVGTYTAEVTFPLKGAWDVLASVAHGEDEFSISLRAFVEEK